MCLQLHIKPALPCMMLLPPACLLSFRNATRLSSSPFREHDSFLTRSSTLRSIAG